jgi:hypothetical protein
VLSENSLDDFWLLIEACTRVEDFYEWLLKRKDIHFHVFQLERSAEFTVRRCFFNGALRYCHKTAQLEQQ